MEKCGNAKKCQNDFALWLLPFGFSLTEDCLGHLRSAPKWFEEGAMGLCEGKHPRESFKIVVFFLPCGLFFILQVIFHYPAGRKHYTCNSMAIKSARVSANFSVINSETIQECKCNGEL